MKSIFLILLSCYTLLSFTSCISIKTDSEKPGSYYTSAQYRRFMTMQKMKNDDALESLAFDKGVGMSIAEILKGPALNKLHLYKVGLFHGFSCYTWAR